MSNDTRSWLRSRNEQIPILRASYTDQTFARHSHDHYVIGLVEHGSCRSSYRGGNWTLPVGTLAVMPPGEVHDGVPVPGVPWVWRALYPSYEFIQRVAGELCVSPEGVFAKPLLVSSVESPAIPVVVKEDRGLVRRFRAVHRELEVCDLSAECSLLEFLSELVIRHHHGTLREPKVGKEPAAVRTLKEFIHSNATSRVRLQDLSTAVGFSEGYLTRLFTRAVGIPPHAYLTQVRVEIAKRMILEGSDLSTVAHAVGFSDQSHFTNRFRDYVGVTPGEFSHAL